MPSCQLQIFRYNFLIINMKKLNFKIVEDLNEAKKLWEAFSPFETIDDEWDFRYIFNKYLGFPLHFIVGYDGEQAVGLLPMQLNTNNGVSQKLFGVDRPFLEFFGGIDTDNNRIFFKNGYEDYTEEFLNQIKDYSILAPLSIPYSFKNSEALHYTDKFEQELTNIKDLDSFLQTFFDGKSRQKMKNKLNRINRDFKIKISKGSDSDLNLLFALSKDRFGDNSAFHMEYREEIFKELCEKFQSDIFVVYVDGEPKAVSFALIHKGVYDGIGIGYDYEIRDLGKFVFLTQIQRATAELNCKKYDVGKNDNGWKAQLHLNRIPQYKLSINNPRFKPKKLPLYFKLPVFRNPFGLLFK